MVLDAGSAPLSTLLYEMALGIIDIAMPRLQSYCSASITKVHPCTPVVVA